jgi:hypothetical protein
MVVAKSEINHIKTLMIDLEERRRAPAEAQDNPA